MRRSKWLFVLSILFGMTALLRAADLPKIEKNPLQVAEVAIGTGITDKELVGNTTDFNISVGRVYCWSKITAENVPTVIRHVWYVDGDKIAEVPLSVQVSPMRTWSSKAVWAGKWKVEVVDERREHILATAGFTVKE